MNQLNPNQIKAAFGLCDRPVKRLIRDYFVQFDKKFVKKGKGPVLKNGEKLPSTEIPKEYSDQGGIMKLVHGDSSKNEFDTGMLSFDSILKIPDGCGHLTVPKKLEDGGIEIWTLGLHLRGSDATFDTEHLKEFSKTSDDPEKMESLILQLAAGFYPSATIVFNYLKMKHVEMKTLNLGYNASSGAIVITDDRFPNLQPNARLIVQLRPREEDFDKNTDANDTSADQKQVTRRAF